MAVEHEVAGATRLIDPEHTYASVTDRVAGITLRFPHNLRWLALLGLALCGVGLFAICMLATFVLGVGIWGINIPVAWAYAIVNFVWWIGIGHAGTLISAILFLLHQRWRNSINRFAEAMTLFAVAMAGMFPLLHLGRPIRFYYILPYPDVMNVWPQWRSPLVWDVIAVLTYFTISLIFWYQGLIPDLASIRDLAKRRWVKCVFGLFALGWRGSAKHWQRYQMSYLLLAGLATPLVVSVHSIVSLDFATAVVPGWHETIFPPYFVAGAIYSGFAMVFMLLLPLLWAFRLQDVVTERHLDASGKVMLVSGLVVSYGYVMECFTAWYSADRVEVYRLVFLSSGHYAWALWIVVACNVVIGQALWFRRVRVTPWALLLVSLCVQLGMWAERFAIIVPSLSRDFMPSAWGPYSPTFYDVGLLIGSIFTFFFLFLLFVRFVPMSSISELRELIHQTVKERRARAAAGETRRGDAKRAPSGQEGKGARLAPVTSALEGPLQPVAFERADVPDAALHGVVAEFDDAEEFVEAARQARDAGFLRLGAYSPFPLEELPQALRLGRAGVSSLVLLGGLVGAGGMFFMMSYSATYDYPWNIGGRPFFSWPSFIPLTFEVGVLGGGLFGLFGMLFLNRLPRLHHPIFNASGFERASRDRFFLCIERRDVGFERHRARLFLEQLRPLRISEVPE